MIGRWNADMAALRPQNTLARNWLNGTKKISSKAVVPPNAKVSRDAE